MSDSAPWREQVRAEQVASLYRNGLVTIPVTWVAGGVLAAVLVYAGDTPVVAAWSWFAALTVQTAGRVALVLAYRRMERALSDWKRWADWFTAGMAAGGVVWGIGTLFIMPEGRFDLQMLVVLIISALVYGAAPAMGLWPASFFAFFLPAMIPGVVWSFFQGGAEHLAYGILGTIWIVAVGVVTLRFSRGAVRALEMGLENAALARDLRAQKAIADEANAAKTRFLAAASHDLRQPLHALGLFVGALRHETLPPNAARLAARIDGATDALDKLFTGLLDVSKLDAGVVRPEPRPLDAGELLLRLVGELRPAAEAKGLKLRLHQRSAWVVSDPLLLERIVRNLIANAVRYTETGEVLVSIRTAGRREAAIEVWDTGPGIPEALRERVFEEFYQVKAAGNEQGGLGLGLSIVRRLAALLGHRLELRSRLGKGSVFRIRVPMTAELKPAVSASSEPQSAIARIWVIDDDASVLAAMQALLGAWGHHIAIGGSSDQMLDLIDGGEQAPDVILCDWQLGGETGVEAIRKLQARFERPVPAALITGDTDPARLREAASSGLPLLHKPVGKAQLRALIGNLVRAGASEPSGRQGATAD